MGPHRLTPVVLFLTFPVLAAGCTGLLRQYTVRPVLSQPDDQQRRDQHECGAPRTDRGERLYIGGHSFNCLVGRGYALGFQHETGAGPTYVNLAPTRMRADAEVRQDVVACEAAFLPQGGSERWLTVVALAVSPVVQALVPAPDQIRRRWATCMEPFGYIVRDKEGNRIVRLR